MGWQRCRVCDEEENDGDDDVIHGKLGPLHALSLSSRPRCPHIHTHTHIHNRNRKMTHRVLSHG